MESACIVTDGSAQFTNLSHDLQKLITVVPLPININGKWITAEEGYKPGKLPKFASSGNTTSFLSAPSRDTLLNKFLFLGKKYENIFAIFISSALNPCYQVALDISEDLKGNINVQVIDSRTTSLGLGILVQKVSEKISHGCSIDEIDKFLRLIIPRIYSILCIPGLSYLYNNRFIDLGQALIGEYLGIFPLHTIEEGKLIAFDKARNLRNIIDFYSEFAEEFTNINDIALLQTAPPNAQLSQLFREQMNSQIAGLPISEIPINLTLASLFGPKTSGLFILDNMP